MAMIKRLVGGDDIYLGLGEVWFVCDVVWSAKNLVGSSLLVYVLVLL